MKKTTSLVFALGLLILSAATSAVPVYATPLYESPPEELPKPVVSDYAVPFGISNNNPPVMVGYADKLGFLEYAVFWFKNSGVWQVIPLETPSTTMRSMAYSVNDNGWIVGLKGTPPNYEAWLWKINPITGVILSSEGLGFLGEGTKSYARSINNDGEVVGTSTLSAASDALPHGFFWKHGRGMVDLGVVSGDEQSIANDLGAKAIVGTSVTGGLPGLPKAVIWTKPKEKAIQTLPLPAGFTGSQARRINKAGLILGMAYVTGSDNFHAILWTPAKIMGEILYAPLDLGVPGDYERSIGADINDEGTILIQGYAGTGATERAGAYVRVPGISALIRLTPISNDIRVFAYGINNQGIIIGAVDESPPGNPTPVLWLP